MIESVELNPESLEKFALMYLTGTAIFGAYIAGAMYFTNKIISKSENRSKESKLIDITEENL